MDHLKEDKRANRAAKQLIDTIPESIWTQYKDTVPSDERAILHLVIKYINRIRKANTSSGVDLAAVCALSEKDQCTMSKQILLDMLPIQYRPKVLYTFAPAEVLTITAYEAGHTFMVRNAIKMKKKAMKAAKRAAAEADAKKGLAVKSEPDSHVEIDGGRRR